MNGWYIASLVLGSISIVIDIVMFIVPHRKVNILCKLAFDIVSVINYLCIYYATNTVAIFAALGCQCVAIVRDIIFFKRKKGNWADNIYWLLGLNVLFGLLLIWTWTGPISLLPTIGNIINTTALYIYKKKYTRTITMIGETLFIAYYAILLQDSSLLTLFSLLGAVAVFTSALVGLILLYVRDKKRKQIAESQVIDQENEN